MKKIEKNIKVIRAEEIIEAKYSLTNKQNVIMDMLLSELTDDDTVDYVLSVEKFRPLITQGKTNLYRDLQAAVASFEGQGLHIFSKTLGTVYYPWFSKIHYKPNAEIVVRIDKDLKKIMYEAQKKVSYDIKNTINLKSAYSQRFYYFLKSFEDTQWRYDKIEDLIDKLECPPSCKNFARFESSVLKKAKTEINAKTDLNFEYEVFKTGKKVTHIKSYISTKNILTAEERNTINEKYIISSLGGLINGLEDARKILDILSQIDCDDKRRYFEEEVDKVLKYHNHKRSVPFIALLISALKNPWQSSIPKQTGFHNFEPRSIYNNESEMKCIERGLLGWE